MTKELTTRGPFQPNGLTVKWALKSGQGSTWDPEIQLAVPGPDGRVLSVPMDVHEAGDLHRALEAHMENVAAHEVKPITPEERDRLLRKDRQERIRLGNLKAFQEEIDNPLKPCTCGARKTREACTCPHRAYTAAQMAAEDVLSEWLAIPTFRREEIKAHHRDLAAALDRLAALNA